MLRHSSISLARRARRRLRPLAFPTTRHGHPAVCNSSHHFSSEAAKRRPQQQQQLSKQEVHNQQVATAQALKKERRQRHEQEQNASQASKIQRRQRHEEEHNASRHRKKGAAKRQAMVHTIEHWLKKDPTFITATMEALDLNPEISNQPTNSDDSTDQPILELVRKQYRQLYKDTIPTFREQLLAENPSEPLQKAMAILSEAGFDDPQWSKQFRQYRGYSIQRSGLGRSLSKAEEAIAERGKALLAEQDNLQIMVEKDQAVQERFAKKAAKRAEEEKAKQEVEADSLFAKVISGVASFLPFGNEDQEIIYETTKESTNEKKFRPTRLQRRIQRKRGLLEELEADFLEASKRIQDINTLIQQLKSPLSDSEYELARNKMAEARTHICGELANQIRHRHEELITQYQALDSKTDLTKPHEWYPYARLDRRKIIFHGGPTNSGKTYAALQRLKEAKNGLYLGPLRLLAAEVYEDLTSDGHYTNLFTGQEKREIAFSTHASATVEMSSWKDEHDVVVIDEIQMIADLTRGAAWTKALLSLRCKEIHVCGGLEARSIVQKIAEVCGDEFELNTYERFSPLHVAQRSISNDPNKPGCYKRVKPGDCVVAFSRNDIFAIKREIERTTKYKCCVIYGRLPPTIRADQARRFNDPDSGYDILVASDAIGMGLNLNIKRIIFNTIFKFNGEKVVRLSHSDVKQISGRAGRRNSPYPHGEVTCRDPRDLPFIQQCMSTEIPKIEQAALLPTPAHIEFFSQALESYGTEQELGLHNILRQFSAMATVKGDYFLGRQTEMRTIAQRLKRIPLNVRDAYTLCLSPTTENSLVLLESFATKLSRGEVAGLPSRSVPKKAKSFDDLSYLCNIYSDADLFLWIQNKFPPANAVEQQAALARKEKTLEYINEALAATEQLKLVHCYIKTGMRQRAAWEAANGPSELLDDTGDFSDEDEYSDEEAAL